MATAQEMIDKGRMQEEAIASARKGMRQERFKQASSFAKKVYSEAVMPGRIVGSKLQKGYGSMLKSKVKAQGIAGMIKQFAPAQGGMMIEDIGGSQQYQSQGGTGRGRGRPNQSFTPKFLPGVGVVRMPVQAYKRALTMQKAKMRLQQELQKSRLSSMPMSQEMPPQEYGAEEVWAMQQPQQQMQMPQQEMYPQQQQQPGGGFGRFASNFGSAMQKIGGYLAPRPPMSAGYGQVERTPVWGGQQQMQQPMRPQNILATPGNILNTPNIFNRRGDTKILFR